MEIYEIRYGEHAFAFEPTTRDALEGRLRLEERRDLLSRLLEQEDETWYLDDDGQRLPVQELFKLSPWTGHALEGRIKLLCRFIDLRNGRVKFDLPDSYVEVR